MAVEAQHPDVKAAKCDILGLGVRRHSVLWLSRNLAAITPWVYL